MDDDDELLRVLDPDWDHVNPNLAEHDGRRVRLTFIDEDGVEQQVAGTLAVDPGLHGNAARLDDE